MTKPSIKVNGANELRRALKHFDDGVSDLKSAHAEAAEIVEQRSTQLVPRLTGTLASTIRSSGQASGGVVRAGKASVPWAGPIHFGWPGHNISPQPFMYDALDDRTTQVIDVYQRRVTSLIKKYELA